MVQSDEDKQQAGKITEKEKTEFQNLRQEHYNNWVDAFNNYNKYLITLSAGGIGLSITLISFVKNNSSINYSWIAIAWVCWSVTIILVLLSFTLSTYFHSNRDNEYREDIEILDGKIITDDDRRKRDKKREGNTSLSRKVDKLGWFALGTFCLGIIFVLMTVSKIIAILLVFVYVVIWYISIYKERENL